MIAQLIGGEPIPLDGSDVVFADGDRASYSTVLRWTDDELDARGMYVVDDPPPPPPLSVSQAIGANVEAVTA